MTTSSINERVSNQKYDVDDNYNNYRSRYDINRHLMVINEDASGVTSSELERTGASVGHSEGIPESKSVN